MAWLYGIVAVTAIYSAHRLACWAEDRGYIYYRKSRGSAGHAFLEIQSMIEPSKKHVLEVMHEQEDEDEQDDSGDQPPDS